MKFAMSTDECPLAAAIVFSVSSRSLLVDIASSFLFWTRHTFGFTHRNMLNDVLEAAFLVTDLSSTYYAAQKYRLDATVFRKTLAVSENTEIR